jgi:hypothetical protein
MTFISWFTNSASIYDHRRCEIIIFSNYYYCMFAAFGFLLVVDRDTLSVYGQQEQQYSFLMSWGSKGVALGSFKQPLEIAIDSNGDVHVTDISRVSNQVQKFTNNGTFITSWGSRFR